MAISKPPIKPTHSNGFSSTSRKEITFFVFGATFKINLDTIKHKTYIHIQADEKAQDQNIFAIGTKTYNNPVTINVQRPTFTMIAESIPPARRLDIKPDDGGAFPVISLYTITPMTISDEIIIRKNHELKKRSQIAVIIHLKRLDSDFIRTHMIKRVFPTNKKLVIPHVKNHAVIDVTHAFNDR